MARSDNEGTWPFRRTVACRRRSPPWLSVQDAKGKGRAVTAQRVRPCRPAEREWYGRAVDRMARAAGIGRQRLRRDGKGKEAVKGPNRLKKAEAAFRRIAGKDGHRDRRLDG